MLTLATLEYAEPSPSIWWGHYRINWLSRKHRVQKLPDRPNMIGNADGDTQRDPQGFVNAAEVEKNHVQRHGGDVVI